MSETGSEQKDRPNVKFGTLSILCFLGGLGLTYFLSLVSTDIGRLSGTGGYAVMVGLGCLAWLIGLVFGVVGLCRGEQPRWPAAVGCILVLCSFYFDVTPADLAAPRGSRERNARTECLSNEKQILLAMAMYADQNQGRLPIDSTNPTLVGSLRLLSNLVTTARVFHCPDDHRPGARAEMDYRRLTTLNISYSYVPNLRWQDTPDSPVILDRIYSTTNGSTWSATGNHGDKGGNVGFNDGHVQWCNALPAALKDKDGKQVVLSP